MKSQGQQRYYSAPALDKGLDILEHLAAEPVPLSQLEIAQRLGRTSGEIYRMLMCLEERGYVIRESESGKFRLTLRIYELAHRQNPTSLLRRAARLPMETLTEEIGQACHLSVQFGRSILVLLERMPTRQICLAVGEGTSFSLIQTTSGKVLLSWMDRDSVIKLLENDPLYVEMSESKRRSLLRMLESIRKARELVAESALSKGVTDIAVTVGTEGTDTFAVLAVSFLTAASTSFIRSAVIRCASQINRNLGIEA